MRFSNRFGIAEQFCWFQDEGATKMLDFDNPLIHSNLQKVQKSLCLQDKLEFYGELEVAGTMVAGLVA